MQPELLHLDVLFYLLNLDTKTWELHKIPKNLDVRIKKQNTLGEKFAHSINTITNETSTNK